MENAHKRPLSKQKADGYVIWKQTKLCLMGPNCCEYIAIARISRRSSQIAFEVGAEYSHGVMVCRST